MKRVVLILVLIITLLTFLLFTSCSFKNKSLKNNNDAMKLVVYSVKRDTFQSFLNDLDSSLFKEEYSKEYVYLGKQLKHEMQDCYLFTIDKKLVDFVNNHQSIEAYFETQNIDVNIQGTLVFEAPHIPITIWVKTNDKDYFITVNEQPFDEPYVYRLYTFSDYKNIYGDVDATLTVNGKKVICDAPIKIYNKYADVPLVEVLKGFGAVTHEQEEIIKVTVNNTSYLLDETNVTLYREDNSCKNLLYQTAGGTTFFEYINGVLMVDTDNLVCVLKSMGIDATIILDKEAGQIQIHSGTQDNTEGPTLRDGSPGKTGAGSLS